MFATDSRPAPPKSAEIEQALLASLFVVPAGLDHVADRLRPDHFAEPVHARVFETMVKIADGGAVPSLPAIIARVGDEHRNYLTRVAASVVTTVNNADYAATLVDLWQRREALDAIREAEATIAVVDADRPAPAVIEETEERLSGIVRAREAGKGLRPVARHLDAALAHIERASQIEGGVIGVPSGLVDLDNCLGGFMASELTIIAGRPKMGKSTVAKTIALHAARQAHGVAWFSLEMSGELIGMALLADLTGIPINHQRRGKLTAGEWARLHAARAELDQLPILIEDAPGISMAYIRSQCRRMKRRGKLGLIITDHLGHITASQEARRQSRTSEVTEITAGLLKLAKEFETPVIALSQLSRAVEQRDDKRPTLADLRDSGSIEQDAHNIVFVYRPEYYLSREEPKKRSGETAEKFTSRLADWEAEMAEARGVCELIVAASRTGPTETVRVFWDPERSRVGNLQTRGFV